MRIQILGCAGGSAPSRQLTSFRIDEDFVVDAGAITTALDLRAQQAIPSVVLTHSHMDHVWSLPLFLSNRFAPGVPPCPIYGSAETLEAVHKHLFNGRIWPDFSMIQHEGRPMLEMHRIEADTTFQVNGYGLTPVEMHHTVPCRGYRIEDGAGTFLIAGDTGPSDAIWALANDTANLRGMIIECSFPDSLGDLAEKSRHLTPSTLAAQLRKLRKDVPVYITHMKPGYEEQLLSAIDKLDEDRIHILQTGDTITV